MWCVPGLQLPHGYVPMSQSRSQTLLVRTRFLFSHELRRSKGWGRVFWFSLDATLPPESTCHLPLKAPLCPVWESQNGHRCRSPGHIGIFWRKIPGGKPHSAYTLSIQGKPLTCSSRRADPGCFRDTIGI
jgi:hypothetical protein